MTTDHTPRQYVGVREIAEFLGISKARVNELIDQGYCPPPYQTLRMGRVWLLSDIISWSERRRSKPGRPPSSPSGYWVSGSKGK